MSEYILKLQQPRGEKTSAPYLKEIGGVLFIHLFVPHPRQALKFDNLSEVLFFCSQLPKTIAEKFVARPYYEELKEFTIARTRKKLFATQQQKKS